MAKALFPLGTNPMRIIEQLFGSRIALAVENYGVGVERELTFYVKMSDLSVLENLTAIKQEQWKLDLKGEHPDAKFRARVEDGKAHSICCKIPHRSGEGMVEAETLVNDEFYNFMIKFFGHHGYKKTRYIYPIPETDLKFEIDVFLSESGHPHPYVKVDLEYPEALMVMPAFPFPVDEDTAIIGNEMTKEEEAFVDDLWENQWSRMDSTKGSLDPYYNRKQ